jgi:hypothetical protein
VIPVLRALLVGAAAWAAIGQTVPQTAASRFALVSVFDSRGRALVDVGPDDFVVQERGESREILDVRVADYPIVVALDNGLLGRTDFPSVQKAAGRFLDRLGPRAIALVSMGGPPQLIASFDEERHSVLAHLEVVTAGSTADAQPLKAAALAAQTIRQTGTLFSALLLMTVSPVEVTGPAADDLIAPIVESRAIVHVVVHAVPGGAGVPIWRGLVEQTRGEYRAIYSSASYAPALDRLADRLTTELMVEYLVPVGSKPTDPRVGIRMPGARVRGLGVEPR